MNKYLDEYSMRQASIFELRTIARDMGVNSPTIYKKEDLIEKILKIASGEEKPQMPKSRQGRPPKKKIGSFIDESSNVRLDAFNNFANQKIRDMSLNKKDFDNTEFSQSWVLACPNTFNYSSEEDTNNSKFLYESKIGYLYIMEDGSGFIFQMGRSADADTAVFISNKTIVDFGLKNGDLVECVCKKIISNETRYLTEIKSINNVDIKDYKKEDRINFETIKLKKPSDKKLFNFEKKYDVLNNIGLATRNILKCKNLKNYIELSNQIAGQNEGCVVVNINLEVLPEDIDLIEYGPNNEVFYTLYGDSKKQNALLINLAIERIKRLVEQNKNVFVLVNEVGKLIKYQNFSLDYQSNDVKYKSLDSVYKLLTLARYLDDNKSVTILCMFKNFVFAEKAIIIEEELDNLNCNFIEM